MTQSSKNNNIVEFSCTYPNFQEENPFHKVVHNVDSLDDIEDNIRKAQNDKLLYVTGFYESAVKFNNSRDIRQYLDDISDNWNDHTFSECYNIEFLLEIMGDGAKKRIFTRPVNIWETVNLREVDGQTIIRGIRLTVTEKQPWKFAKILGRTATRSCSVELKTYIVKLFKS